MEVQIPIEYFDFDTIFQGSYWVAIFREISLNL